jgi:hypothetical protein
VARLSGRRLGAGVAATAALALVAGFAVQAGAGSSADRQVLPGVSYRLDHVHGTRVHIIAIAPHARIALGVGMAHGGIAGGLQTVRDIAHNTDAIVAVNGDFFLDGAPQGGVVSEQRLLRSPLCNDQHKRPQLSLRPLWQADCGFGWQGSIVAGGRYLPIGLLNRAPNGGALAVFDQHWQRKTPRRHAFEVVLRMMPGSHAGTLGHRINLRWDKRGHGNGGTPVGKRHVVISAAGHDAKQLRALWKSRHRYPDASMRLQLDRPSKQNVGCRPQLLRSGHRVALPPGPFSRGRHARTAVAWAPDGRRWIVTTDAGHGSRGWTLRRLTTYLRNLGATDACNLDGGGSSTMVVRGHLVNTPAYGRQRPVANAVILTTAAPPAQPSPRPSSQPTAVPTPSLLPSLPPLPTLGPDSR